MIEAEAGFLRSFVPIMGLVQADRMCSWADFWKKHGPIR
jgi:hypothetical protein